MRIALSIPEFAARRGGAEGFAASTARGLLALDHQVEVFAERGQSDNLTLNLAPAAEQVGMIRSFAPDVHIDWGLSVPADLHRLGGGVHRAFTRYNACSVAPAFRPYKHLEQLLSPKHIRTRMAEAALLRRPQAHFLAVSEFIAKHIRNEGRIPEEKIFTLLNGVPVERFNFHCRVRYRHDIRRVLKLDDSHVAFLFVAHNPRLKNIALLTRLFAHFHARVGTARLVYMGRHAPRISAPWFIDAGEVSLPERLYSAADVLVHPTFFDACANVVLEAMACGCPVVSSDLNGSAEVIDHGRTGYVLPVTGKSRNAIETHWYEAVMALAEDTGLRRRMGRAAASAIKAHHTMDQYVAELERILDTVARRKADGANQPTPA
jgi:UDP-glucose:(heptosyl)LPS alpha-1,3-glucosyltransferase